MSDCDYHLSRASQERQLADDAADENIRNIHNKLAAAHTAKAVADQSQRLELVMER